MPASRPAIVIAGAGECGTRAAFALREADITFLPGAEATRLDTALIARRAAPDRAAPADPSVGLKSLHRAPVGA